MEPGWSYPLSMAPPELHVTQPLDQVYGFTTEHLAANREGHVIEAQTAPLWGAVLWAGFLGLAALLLGLAAVRLARGPVRVIGPIMGTIAAAALIGIVAVPALRDLITSEVAVVEGKVREQTSVGRGGGEAVLHFEKVRVLTQGTGADSKAAIDDDGVYRAFYLPHTRRLLSIERVDATLP
jgi:hypothetical protein